MPCAAPQPSLLTRALLRVYRAASPETVRAGREWYDVAFSHCERLAAWHDRSIPEVVAALAHLSPRTSWAQNLLLLERLLAGEPKPDFALGRSWEQANRALAAEDPVATFGRRALKTWHFARAILGDQSAVAVDTWIARAVGIPEKSVRSMGGYNAVHDAFHRGAKIERDISPRDLQAVVWVAWRGKAD